MTVGISLAITLQSQQWTQTTRQNPNRSMASSVGRCECSEQVSSAVLFEVSNIAFTRCCCCCCCCYVAAAQPAVAGGGGFSRADRARMYLRGLLQKYKSTNTMPHSGKVVLLDVELSVKHAFWAIYDHGSWYQPPETMLMHFSC